MPKKTNKGKNGKHEGRVILKLNIRSKRTRALWHSVVNAEREKQGLEAHPESHYYAYSFIKVLKAFEGMTKKQFKQIVQKYKAMHSGEEFVNLLVACKMHEDEFSRDNKIKLLKGMIKATRTKEGGEKPAQERNDEVLVCSFLSCFLLFVFFLLCIRPSLGYSLGYIVRYTGVFQHPLTKTICLTLSCMMMLCMYHTDTDETTG